MKKEFSIAYFVLAFLLLGMVRALHRLRRILQYNVPPD